MKVKVKQGENVIFLQANVRTSQHIYFQNNKMEINLEIEKKNIKKKKDNTHSQKRHHLLLL